MGSWSHLQVHVSQAHTQPPGQPGRSINLPFNAVLKLACALVFPSLGAPHGSTHPTRVAPYLWGRRSFRPCRRRPQAAVLSQNSHRAGVRAESKQGRARWREGDRGLQGRTGVQSKASWELGLPEGPWWSGWAQPGSQSSPLIFLGPHRTCLS